jgi:predicted DNA-binding transcriptional regulator YafY
MRAERLLRIVLLLQARGRVTGGTLARELAVSPRTIQRDMEALSSAGIPVYATRGGGGGWALVDSYRTSLAGLTTSDALAIVVGRSRGVLSDLGLDDPGDGPILKLLAAIAPSAREQVEHARRRIHVEQGAWGPPAEPDPTLQILQRAIWDDRLVSLAYGTSPTSVEVAPLGLVRQGGTWYLVARRDTGVRTYRVSRIREASLTGEAFDRPEDFDLPAHWRATSTSFVETRPRYVVRLRLRGDALVRAGWVYTRSKTLSEPDADGWADAVLDLGDEDNAHTVVRQLGTEVLVVEPAALRQAAVAAARSFAAANDEPSHP